MQNKLSATFAPGLRKLRESCTSNTLINRWIYQVRSRTENVFVPLTDAPAGNLNLLQRRVFVSRHARFRNLHASRMDSAKMSAGVFRLSDYDCVGFDLDNTICRYKLTPMVKLEYDVLAQYLVKEKGYDPDYLYQPLQDNDGFMKKGLVLDFDRGNLLKIDGNGIVSSATHGTKFLSDSEIKQVYGEERKWDVASEFTKNMLEAWNGPLSEKIRTLLDYFDMPSALVFARIVDSVDAKEGRPLEQYNIWKDILDGLISMFRRENFAADTGGYFPILKDNPEMFINKCSENVIDWLKTIKRQKITFLITGSHVDFASLVASKSMGENWRSLFDVVVFYARKPGFFIGGRPFLQLEGVNETNPLKGSDLQVGGAYSQGNWQDLYGLLQRATGKKHPKCVYIGDNLLQDVYTPAEYTKCDTVAVVQELLAEGMEEDQGFPDSPVLQTKEWGSYFTCSKNDPHNPDVNYSLWAEIIRKYSKICVPSLEALAQHSLSYDFPCFVTDERDRCKQSGFFPAQPNSLKRYML